jgi:phospholipid/cholesterol/gamma-HCH transport system substrate-binding protein
MSSLTARLTATLLSSRGLAIGALAAGAVAGSAFLSGGGNHQVTARFTDADGLVAGNEIRIAGIPAGSVDSVQVQVDSGTGQQFAVATLDIDDAHWPLHQGTTFAVRPKGVLSNVFVAFNPGPQKNPVLDSGHVFGLKETSSPVNLDEFSNLFNADVRESLRTQIKEGVVAFGGSGADNTNSLLHYANPLSADLDPVTAVLAARSPELDRLNAEWDTLSGDLAREDANLRGLIENGNTLLGAIASHASHLQGTLVHAAGVMTSLDNTLKGEESNLAAIFRKGPTVLEKQQASDEAIVPVLQFVTPYLGDLNQLLNNLVSVSGIANNSNPLQPSNGRYTQDFRVDATIYAGNKRNAYACGGQPDLQPNCTGVPAVKLGSGSASVSPAQPASPSGGSSATGTSSGSSSAQALQPQFGELFQ